MLKNIRIASPCSAKWEQMKGDDQVRHCPECDRNVYNLSAMTEREAEQLIAAHTERLCARFYQRADGTILTQDCPSGRQVVSRRVSRIAGAALSAAMGLGFAAAQTSPNGNWQPMVQIDRSEAGATIHVSDYDGAGVQGATVMLEDSVNNVHLYGTTDADGRLRFPFVAPGRYQLTINAVGFRTYHESMIVGEPRQVETAHSETPGVIDQMQIAELPTDQRHLMVTVGMVLAVPDEKAQHKKPAKRAARSKPAPPSADQSTR